MLGHIRMIIINICMLGNILYDNYKHLYVRKHPYDNYYHLYVRTDLYDKTHPYDNYKYLYVRKHPYDNY